VLLSVLVVSQMAPVIVLVGSGIVAFGVVWYAVYTRRRVVGEGLLREAIRPGPATRYRVVVPVANPATQRRLLRLAAASARANAVADDPEPELVAVNVVRVEHPSPLQNVEADRDEGQRELLANAREFAGEMDVHLRTRAVVAPDTATALLTVLEEEDADEVILGWDGTLAPNGSVEGSTVEAVLERAPCDVALVSLRGDVGKPVGVVASGRNAVAVARRAVEFAAVEGTVPTLLAVRPSDADAADGRTDDVVTETAEAAGLAPDAYTVEVVDEAALREALSRYETVCVGLSSASDGSESTTSTVLEAVGATSRAQNVALVRDSS
jgi:nucleotide-binding universal stress UspA family protein